MFSIHSHTTVRRWCLALTSVAILGACNIGEPDLPAGVTDPNLVKTWPNAIAALQGTRQEAQSAFSNYITASGSFTDELREWSYTNYDPIDAREPSDRFEMVYSRLHAVRNSARQAIGLFNDVGKDSSLLQRSELYSLAGYAELMLAELFCSGIPLSTIDYEKDYTYTEGFTTDQVFRHAMTLFDTAMTLGAGRQNLEWLARMGKARAYVGINQLDSAARFTTTVPDTFTFTYTVPLFPSPASTIRISFNVPEREGGVGLPFRSAADPRVVLFETIRSSRSNYQPLKYVPANNPATFTATVVLTSGVEARLIEAEAALANNQVQAWVDKLNALRRTRVTPAMADTTAPATPRARVDLHFYERAFWLFLTGQRQGDLRRMQRFYERTPEELYPQGAYSETANYGGAIIAQVPQKELLNPKYQGCFNYGA